MTETAAQNPAQYAIILGGVFNLAFILLVTLLVPFSELLEGRPDADREARAP